MAALVFATSCATNPRGASIGRKFKAGDSADLVLRYSSDSTIFRLKPDGRDGAFYRIFTRNEICALDAARSGPRDLAVVVIGHNRTPEVERQVVDSWEATLARLNYRRVIILRFNGRDEVDGMRVVDEKLLAGRTGAEVTDLAFSQAEPLR